MELKLNKVNFSYGNNLVLVDANFVAPSKKFVCLHYKKGDGATTLAKICCGLLKPQSGSVFAGDQPIVLEDQNVSLLFSQQLFLERKTALQNLQYAAKVQNKNVDKETLQNLLQFYGIDPNGKPCKMSTKQRLLLALARVDFGNKPIVVFDNIFEPLLPSEIKEVLPYVAKVAKDKTAIMLETQRLLFCGAKNWCLVFGKLYEVPPSNVVPKVAFAKQIQNPHQKWVVGNVVSNNGKMFIRCVQKDYALCAAHQKILQNKMVEKVIVFLDDNQNIESVYDEMDELLLFKIKKILGK